MLLLKAAIFYRCGLLFMCESLLQQAKFLVDDVHFEKHDNNHRHVDKAFVALDVHVLLRLFHVYVYRVYEHYIINFLVRNNVKRPSHLTH